MYVCMQACTDGQHVKKYNPSVAHWIGDKGIKMVQCSCSISGFLINYNRIAFSALTPLVWHQEEHLGL